MPPPLQDVWHYLTTDDVGKQILAGLIVALVLAVLGIIVGIPAAILRFIKRALFRRSSRLSEEAQVFEAITDPASLLPKLYSEENNPDPLAHHRIRYQPRDPDPERDTQAQLRAALNLKRYLLITAPTGYGKTREAATLTQSLMNEGWRVVRVRAGWLDKPNDLPPALRDDRRRIIILLDDLNGMFSRGDYVQAPQRDTANHAAAALVQSSYHDRLRDALDAFERMCTPNEIRVIATARDEADQWLPLHYDERDDLWKRFTRVELPAPRDSAIAALLDEEVSRANLAAERTEFAAIARENDGTYANVVLNLQRAEKEGNSLNLANYTATLDGSWREVYERALRQHPAVCYLYDAMDVLR